MPEQSAPRPSLPSRQSGGFSVWKSLLLPVLIVIGLFGLFEILARLPAARLVFPLRSYGNFHTQFEIKWQKLDQFVQEHGGVDIILLGNSMVNTGVDPEVFVKYISQSSETSPRVFNFGVEGLTVAPMVDLARLLIDTYHPAAILYYTELRDYIAGNGDNVADQLFANEWLQYRMGQNSVIGWAVDHSVALQSLLTWRNWSRDDFLDTYLQNLRRWENTRADGYEPEIQFSKFDGKFPDRDDPDNQEFFEIYGNYSIDPGRLEDLEALLALDESGTSIWITEFPAYPGFYEYFGGQQVHKNYLDTISDFVASLDGVFIPPIDPGLIPLKGRNDDHHLNFMGARIYSGLQARQLSRICRAQTLCLVGE